MRRFAPLLALATLATFASCASQVVPTATPAPGAPRFAETPSSSVAILPAAPETFVVLGEVRIDLPGIRREAEVVIAPDVQRAIREAAASLGANAVIDVKLVRRNQGGRSHQHYSSPVERVLATAIRTTAIKAQTL